MQTDYNVELDEQQEYAISRIREGSNVFISSPAGYGKSVISRQVSDSTTVVGCPTGAAALNEGGYTLHKLFKLPLSSPTVRDWSKCPKEVKSLFGEDSGISRLLIGEVGMLRADYLGLINKRLQLAKGNTLPFGGIQVVTSGDLLQLSPIVGAKERYSFNKQYDSPYAFSSDAWNFERIELLKSYRTVDEQQVMMLESIRKKDKWSGMNLAKIQSEAEKYDIEKDQLHLCCYRADAYNYNMYRYNQHIGTERKYLGKRSKKTDMWKEAPVPVDLLLKIGCRVIIKANCMEGNYVNGDRGTVVLFGKDFVRVELERGGIVDVTPFTWEKKGLVNDSGELVSKVESKLEQVPLALGYAISVHASQGATIQSAALDIGKGCFAEGQLYTSLSRMTDLRNLSFVKYVNKSNIKVSQDVLNFYMNN